MFIYINNIYINIYIYIYISLLYCQHSQVHGQHYERSSYVYIAISSIDLHTIKISKFVDHNLQRHGMLYHPTLKTPQIS